MTQDLLHTYALARSLYDEGSDIIDTFWPFVLRVLPGDGSQLDFQTIRDSIQEQYQILVPLHTLSTLAKRAKTRGLVVASASSCSLTSAGAVKLAALENERDVERRINSLVKHFGAWLATRPDAALAEEQARGALLSFVQSNLESLAAFIAPKAAAPPVAPAAQDRTAADRELFEYLRCVEDDEPQMFAVVRELIFGSLLTSSLSSEAIHEVDRRFEATTLYVDSNFALSLLGLHHDSFNEAATELVQLIQREPSLTLRVFDFTVDEIVGVLKDYPRNGSRYVRGVKVSSIYSSLREQKWTPATAAVYVADIEQHLRQVGLVPESTLGWRHGVDLKAADRVALSGYKPDQGERGQTHDLTALHRIRQIRGGPRRRLESARCFFLTSDRRLALYTYDVGRHGANGTVPETMLDRVLTNVLWLKHPLGGADVSLNAIIAMHSRDLLINHQVWERFVEAMEEVRAAGAVPEEDLALLVLDQRMREDLAGRNRQDAGQVDSSWVEAAARRARAAQDHVAKEAASRQVEADRNKAALEALAAQREQDARDFDAQSVQKAESLLGVISEKRASIIERCERRWRWISLCARVAVGVGVLVAARLVWGFWNENWGPIESRWSLLAAVLAVLGWAGLLRVPQLSHLLEAAMERCKEGRIKEAGLEELANQLLPDARVEDSGGDPVGRGGTG